MTICEKMEENNLLNEKVTIFPNIFKTKDPHHVAVSKIFDRIKTGKSKELVESIRACTDKKERQKLKAELPSICFAGTFAHRDNQGIIDHSGFICLDFDHFTDDSKLVAFKESLKKNKYVVAAFVSPSGDGMKVVVRIPKDIKQHSAYAESLSKWFKQEQWDDLRDISRVCYESYDPDIYVNASAKVYDILTREKPTIMEFAPEGEKIKDQQLIFRNLKKWLDARDSYHDGNKHNYLVKLATACNRFGLEMEMVAAKLVESYQDKASWVDKGDFYEIVKRVYIAYEHQHGISVWTTKGEMLDFDPDARARDVIYLDDIRGEMLSSFFKGDSRGETTYNRSIDRHWTWKRGELTLMHGLPNMGKSILMLQLMLLKSINEGVRWGIFSPEQNPPIDFYKDLIHMYIGKSTEPWHKYRMNEAEFNQGMDFMKEHFFFVYPKTESPTPQYINDRFEELMIKEKIDGCLIDPFNQLDNDWASAGGRDDQYISLFGAKEKRFALSKNVYKIIIAHPKGNMEKLTDKTQDPELKNSGNYRCPDIYDLAGGAMWGNKMDNILCTHQPYFNTRRNSQKTDGDNVSGHSLFMTQFQSQKIKKPKLIGFPGTANLIFNVKQFRYYEEEGYSELSEHSDDARRGLPAEGVYSPFDKEYKEMGVRSILEKKIKSTDWDKLINMSKRKVQNEQEQEQKEREEKTMVELGLPPDMDEESYDMEVRMGRDAHGEFDHEKDYFEDLPPDDEGF